MRHKGLIGLAAAMLVFGGFVPVRAETIQWPGNGHYYDAVPGPASPPTMSWFAADAAARATIFMGMQGHLATITSALENDFIVNTFPVAEQSGYWLGGFQPGSHPGSGYPEPDQGWQWVTGEPWNYTNWALSEPNNSNFGPGKDHEDGLCFRSDPAHGVGKWNDWLRTRTDYGGPGIIGYVAEFEVVPEPATLSLLAVGGVILSALAWLRHMGRKRSRALAA